MFKLVLALRSFFSFLLCHQRILTLPIQPSDYLSFALLHTWYTTISTITPRGLFQTEYFGLSRRYSCDSIRDDIDETLKKLTQPYVST